VNGDNSLPPPHSPPKSSPAQRPASSAGTSQHLEPEPAAPRRASSGDASQLQLGNPLDNEAQITPHHNEAAEASDCGSFAETLQTISTPGRSPATPSFNPSTPKAMVLMTNGIEVEPLLSGSLDGPEKTPTTRYAETDALGLVDVTASSVT
jgi:protein N-terminal amidase